MAKLNRTKLKASKPHEGKKPSFDPFGESEKIASAQAWDYEAMPDLYEVTWPINPDEIDFPKPLPIKYLG